MRRASLRPGDRQVIVMYGRAGIILFLADLEGDGDLDSLVAGKSRAAISWNEGDGDFRDSGQRLRFTERHGLAVGDFNSDGYLDVFSGATITDFHFWLNQGDGRLLEINQ